MALTDEMRKQIAKDSGVKNPFAKGDKMAAAILGEMAALGLTGGLVGAGGKLVYRGIKGARAIAAARKAIAAAKKAKQASSKTGRAATDANKIKQAGKNLKQQSEVAKKFNKTKPKPESGKTTVMSKPGTAVAVRGRSAAKKTAQPKTMKRVQGTDKTKRQSTLSNQQASSKTKSGLTNVQKAAPYVVGLAVLERATRKGGEAKADRKPVVGVGETGPDKSKPKAKPRVTSSTTISDAQKKSQVSKQNRKSTTGTSPDKAKEGAAAKRTSITASKKAGFGPKGNIFPSNAADRKRLMALYGGTGSAAAKAAARGTQGNLKKGKKK